MLIFGNNSTSGSTGYLNDDMYGHFDSGFLSNWLLPVPACVVKKVSVYANGSTIDELADLRFGIYDANAGPPYSAWPLLATTPTVCIAAFAPAQWLSVDVNIPLAGGDYALGVLDTHGPAMTFSAGIHFTTKINGMSQKTFTGGVFPDPLGICTATTMNQCLYAEYVLAGAYTPTAAHGCQPKCGGT